jgi:hypothetical protein
LQGILAEKEKRKKEGKKMRNFEEENDNYEVIEFYELDQRNEEENIQLLWDLIFCYAGQYKHDELKDEFNEWENEDLESFEGQCFDELERELGKILNEQGLSLRIEDSTLYIEQEIKKPYQKKRNNFLDDICGLEKTWSFIDLQLAY